MDSLFCFVLHWALGSSADEAFILSNGDLGNLAGVATGHLCMGLGQARFVSFSISSQKESLSSIKTFEKMN